MLRRNIMGLVVCLAALGVASLALANVPDLAHSSATAASGTAEVSVFVIPDGLGYLMTQAREQSTGPLDAVDATITLTLLDSGDNPVFAYPFEDMWLQTSAGGMVACANGTLADGSTDINGQATFTGPFYAGGHSDRVAGEVTQVVVSGTALTGYDMPILFNSADMNGTGVVNADDLILFASTYQSAGYDYECDLFFDGLENLSDLVLFAAAYNVVCP